MIGKHGARTALVKWAGLGLSFALVMAVSGCGGGLFGGRDARTDADDESGVAATREQALERKGGATLSDVLGNSADPNITVEVNKYIWQASLEVLNFLPIETVDPFTGVIVTGYGTPPGGGRSYRATVYVQDPALDARSLKVALQGSGGGAVAPDTVRAIEDAILTRARQLRVRDAGL